MVTRRPTATLLNATNVPCTSSVTCSVQTALTIQRHADNEHTHDYVLTIHNALFMLKEMGEWGRGLVLRLQHRLLDMPRPGQWVLEFPLRRPRLRPSKTHLMSPTPPPKMQTT